MAPRSSGSSPSDFRVDGSCARSRNGADTSNALACEMIGLNADSAADGVAFVARGATTMNEAIRKTTPTRLITTRADRFDQMCNAIELPPMMRESIAPGGILASLGLQVSASRHVRDAGRQRVGSTGRQDQCQHQRPPCDFLLSRG